MRKIKFRAWLKATKTMFFVKIITMTSEGVFACFLTDEVSSRDVNPDEIILMQFIGRKDKNGTEIYEGDICKGRRGDDSSYRGYVLWNSKCSFYGLWMGVPWSSISNAMPLFELNELEVIGNIHEDKHLLEKKDG